MRFYVFCLFSPCNFSPIFRPVVNSSKGVNEERKLVEVNERFFMTSQNVSHSFFFFFFPCRAGCRFWEKENVQLFIYTLHRPYCYHVQTFTRASGDPQWRFRRHAFSLYYLKIGSDSRCNDGWKRNRQFLRAHTTTQTRRHTMRPTPTIGRSQKDSGGEQPL